MRSDQTLEGAFDVAQLAQGVVAAQYHADRVEADSLRRGPAGGLSQPRRREAAQAGALTCPQSYEGLVLGQDAARADAPRLDLGKHERDAVERDEVDLPGARSDVVREKLKAPRAQMSRGDLLAGPSQGASRVGVLRGWLVRLPRTGP